MEFQREVSCFLVPGGDILSITTDDNSGGVAFDFFTIWEKLKKINCDEVCMIHSHPPSCPEMSGIDRNQVYGWVQALGKPIYFVIICDGELISYYCRRDKDNKSKVIRERIDIVYNEQFKETIELIEFLSNYKYNLLSFKENIAKELCEMCEMFKEIKPNVKIREQIAQDA